MSKQKPVGKIRAAILNWFGVPIMPTDELQWWIGGGGSIAGKTVNVNSTLQLSTAWACVSLKAETVSTLPLKVYERMPDGTRRVAADHPIYALLCRSPNAEMTPSRMMLQVVASLCLWGNAYVEKVYMGSRLVALQPLLPQNVRVKRLPNNGALVYVETVKGVRREITEDQMLHLRGFGLDGVIGLAPMYAGAETLGAAIAANESSSKMFKQGMQSSGYLSTENQLKPEQREKVRESIERFSGSEKAGKTMVLENGFKYYGISMNPEVAQLLETRSFNVEEVCRLFRVPPFMVGHLDKQSSWASSTEGMMLNFLTNTLRPMLVNIEQEIARSLIPAKDFERFFVSFNVEGLLRADSKGRSEFYNSAVNNGWMSRNEVRAKEDLPPIAGGEVYTVQSALIPLDQVGKNYGGSAQ